MYPRGIDSRGLYRSLVFTSCSFCSDINIGDGAVKWYPGPKMNDLAVSGLTQAKTPAESGAKTGQPGRIVIILLTIYNTDLQRVSSFLISHYPARWSEVLS